MCVFVRFICTLSSRLEEAAESKRRATASCCRQQDGDVRRLSFGCVNAAPTTTTAAATTTTAQGDCVGVIDYSLLCSHSLARRREVAGHKLRRRFALIEVSVNYVARLVLVASGERSAKRLPRKKGVARERGESLLLLLLFSRRRRRRRSYALVRLRRLCVARAQLGETSKRSARAAFASASGFGCVSVSPLTAQRVSIPFVAAHLARMRRPNPSIGTLLRELHWSDVARRCRRALVRDTR